VAEVIKNAKEKTPQGIQCPKLLSVKGAASYLGVTEWHMRQLIWNGYIPVVELPPNHKKQYLDVQDLDALIPRYKKRIQ
jgi:hypothetical protein